jgi:hypothetical protein
MFNYKEALQDKNMIRSEFFFSKLNIDVTALTANSEMTSSIFTKLMNLDNKKDTYSIFRLLTKESMLLTSATFLIEKRS